MWWDICKLWMGGIAHIIISLAWSYNTVVYLVYYCFLLFILLLSIPCRKTIQVDLLLLLVIESLMCTWELMYLEGEHMVVDSGMYVICLTYIFNCRMCSVFLTFILRIWQSNRALDVVRKGDVSAAIFAPGWVYETKQAPDFESAQNR